MPFINAFHNHGVLLAIGAISGTENVAIFQAARVLINGVKSLMGLTSAAIGVEISAMLLPRMKDRVWQLLVRNVQFHILVVVLACLSVLPIGEGLFRLWLGGAAHYEGGLMALLLASLFPFALSNTIVMFLAASNVVHRIVLPLLAVALGMIALVAIGVSYAGVTGVGVGVLCGEVAVAAVVWRFAWGYAGLTRVDVLRTFCDWSAIRQDVSVAGDRLRQGLSRGFKSH
jgi:O-antigen/teichoic acid export membrane protein